MTYVVGFFMKDKSDSVEKSPSIYDAQTLALRQAGYKRKRCSMPKVNQSTRS